MVGKHSYFQFPKLIKQKSDSIKLFFIKFNIAFTTLYFTWHLFVCLSLTFSMKILCSHQTCIFWCWTFAPQIPSEEQGTLPCNFNVWKSSRIWGWIEEIRSRECKLITMFLLFQLENFLSFKLFWPFEEDVVVDV